MCVCKYFIHAFMSMGNLACLSTNIHAHACMNAHMLDFFGLFC